MHEINGYKAQILTDSVESSGGSMLSVVPSKGAWQDYAPCSRFGAAFITTRCKANAECDFHFQPFFCKSKNCLQVAFSEQKQVLTNVSLFLKVNVGMQTLDKCEIPVAHKLGGLEQK